MSVYYCWHLLLLFCGPCPCSLTFCRRSDKKPPASTSTLNCFLPYLPPTALPTIAFTITHNIFLLHSIVSRTLTLSSLAIIYQKPNGQTSPQVLQKQHRTMDSLRCLSNKTTTTSSIPIPEAHIRKTNSEIQLENDKLLYEWREGVMYHRLVTGMIQRSKEVGYHPTINKTVQNVIQKRQARCEVPDAAAIPSSDSGYISTRQIYVTCFKCMLRMPCTF